MYLGWPDSQSFDDYLLVIVARSVWRWGSLKWSMVLKRERFEVSSMDSVLEDVHLFTNAKSPCTHLLANLGKRVPTSAPLTSTPLTYYVHQATVIPSFVP